MARTVLDARPSRLATCRAAALSHACPTASSNRLAYRQTRLAESPGKSHTRPDSLAEPVSRGGRNVAKVALALHLPVRLYWTLRQASPATPPVRMPGSPR